MFLRYSQQLNDEILKNIIHTGDVIAFEMFLEMGGEINDVQFTIECIDQNGQDLIPSYVKYLIRNNKDTESFLDSWTKGKMSPLIYSIQKQNEVCAKQLVSTLDRYDVAFNFRQLIAPDRATVGTDDHFLEFLNNFPDFSNNFLICML